jgi:myo-inositol 2-dehydrogenase/D-chiro-inositol 1-dehydrogenase
VIAPVRIALIGAGRIGHVHLRSILSHPETCELAVVVDPYQPAIDDIRESFGVDQTSTDLAAVFDDPTIEGVVIAASTETHASSIMEAARSGKAAFCEKPIALDLEATDTALAAVAAAGTMLQIGFQRRFDTGYARAKADIVEGRLGNIEMVRDAMRDPAPPPPTYLAKSGGLFRDMTIHNFDCVRWLKGDDPVEVFAMASALTGDEIRDIGDVDTSVITMKFPDGSLASIENSRRSGFGYDVRTEVFGSEGAMLIGESRQTSVRWLDGKGVHEDHRYFFIERFAPAYEKELLSFVSNIRSGNQPVVTGADGRAAMVLAVAAEESLKRRQPVNPVDVASFAHTEAAHAQS